MTRAIAWRIAAGLGLLAPFAIAPAAPVAKTIPEVHTVEVLPPGDADRVYALDMAFSYGPAGKAYVFDGRRQKVVGMISTGYMPNLVIDKGHQNIIAIGTFWSRGIRGNRTDAAVIYDARTLSPVGEVVLPPGRFLIADKSHNADLTSDGRYLLVTNMKPATSITIIDLPARRVVGMVETPGCMFVYPSGPDRFSSICANGALFTATFDAAGKAQVNRSAPFFDPVKDPVFEHAGLDRANHLAHFISYDGYIHSVDLSGPTPSFAPAWSVTTDAERRREWRPGGWRLIAHHAPSHRLYVLMHRAGPFTHKDPGSEVWVLDLTTRKKVGTIRLKEAAASIMVSQTADAPRLYTIRKGKLHSYDATTGAFIGVVDQVGSTTLELFTYDR